MVLFPHGAVSSREVSNIKESNWMNTLIDGDARRLNLINARRSRTSLKGGSNCSSVKLKMDLRSVTLRQ
jgi:hypothetical protein